MNEDEKMSTMKKILVVTACFQSGISYAQDYFNPLFLGSDVAAIADLSYLNKGNDFTPGEYYLDLYVGDNYIDNRLIKFIDDAKTNKVVPCFTKAIIKSINLNSATLKTFDLDNISDEQCVDILSKLPNASYKTDLVSPSLRISIPQIFLESVRSTLAPEKEWDDGITTYLMNYNFSGSYSKNKNSDNYSSYYLSLSNRFNWGPWRLYGSAYYSENKYGSQSSHEIRSGSIFLSRAISSIKSDIVIGQSSISSSLFDSINYVGVGLSRSLSMVPDSEQGYSPPIRGIVNSRSKITIRQNGAIAYQTYVDAGPYNITDLNPAGSSGDYEVEITADDGSVTSYVVPYSTVTNLLSEGNYDYSIAAGYLDIRSSSKKGFFQGNYTYGLPMKVTAYMGMQLSSQYRAFGFGLGRDLGYLGAISVDAITAGTTLNDGSYKSGQSYRILYAKNFLDSGTNFQLASYRYSTAGYYTFSEASFKKGNSNIPGEYVNTYLLGRRKNTFQININQNIGDYGQLYAWGNQTNYWGASNSTNLQFGWSKTFPVLNGISVNASFNTYKYSGQKNNSFYLSLNMPLSSQSSRNSMYLTNGTSYNTSSHDVSNNTGVSGSLYDNKISYSINQSLNNHAYQHSNTNTNLSYRADMARFTLGTSFNSRTKQVNYGVSGSMLANEGGLVFSRESYNTSTLVEAKGAAGARVIYAGENIVIGKNGYALIPYSQAYHFNSVELDSASFGDNFDIQNKILKTVPTQGAVTKVKFDVLIGYNFLITLDYQGKPIPYGALVENLSNHSTSITNDDGTIYLSGVADNTSFKVVLDKLTSCTFKVSYGSNFTPSLINKLTATCL